MQMEMDVIVICRWSVLNCKSVDSIGAVPEICNSLHAITASLESLLSEYYYYHMVSILTMCIVLQ